MFKHLFLFSTLVIACVECYYVGMKTGEGELRSDGGGSIWAGSCSWLAIHQGMGKCHIRNKESKLVEVGKDLNELHFRSGVPNLQDLMPDDLRWSWRNNNRNKVHNKFDALESSQNHPPPCLWKSFLSWNWSLVPKMLGTAAGGGPKYEVMEAQQSGHG